MTKIAEGMVVRFKPEWCDGPSDREATLLVMECYDNTDRCLVKFLNTGKLIEPTQVVEYDMITMA